MLFRLSRWTTVNLRANFLHMLNLNSTLRKFSAGQFMRTLPSTNNKTSRGLYCTKKRLREVCFAFVLIKVLHCHVPSSSCNMNNLDKMQQKTFQDASLYIFGSNLLLFQYSHRKQSLSLPSGGDYYSPCSNGPVLSLCCIALQCLS